MHEVETAGLRLIPLDIHNLEICIDNFDEMERNLSLRITGTKPGERLRNVLKLRLDKAKADPGNFSWNTLWVIVLKEEKCMVGSMMIKGCPNEYGEI